MLLERPIRERLVVYLQTVAVDIAVIGPRSAEGEISAAKRNVTPRKPTGKKKKKRKMNRHANPSATCDCSCELVPAMIAMEMPLPMADVSMSGLRPKRSTVITPMIDTSELNVNTKAASTVESTLPRPRLEKTVVS